MKVEIIMFALCNAKNINLYSYIIYIALEVNYFKFLISY